MIIIPTILTSSLQELTETFIHLEPHFDRVQIDIVDGQFASNRTIFPQSLSQIETNLSIDFHLMVRDPSSWIDRCLSGFADRIIGQIELMTDQIAFAEKITQSGKDVGLAVDLATSLEKLNPQSLPLIQVLLLMSVPAGQAGQTLNEDIYAKIGKVNQLRQKTNSNFIICIDGGVSSENIDKLSASGADAVAIGRRLTQGDIPANLEAIRSRLPPPPSAN